ncbi:ABC transporter permease [Paenibacillus antarcticus]|uniref:ABC transmembrane type-2 domain-containing protein n=1 Tax=Paenibacillus antarcticus TaxID=253703 RepID=A0A162K7I3_9BACL|nr:ABC transporter permease [Paenibacillus antarcticus]OAB41828.1 hypothetical protein PBAT_20825 [Paenibacillus antarcticus]
MNVWIIACFELRRMLRARTVIISLFLLPLILIFILGTALSSFFNSGDKIPELDPVKVAMVESVGNRGVVTSQLYTFLESPDIAKMIIVQDVPTSKEAERLLRSQKVDFVVTVPVDFDHQVMSGKEAKLQLMLGSNRTANMVAGTVFDSFLDDINHGRAVTFVASSMGLRQDVSVSSASPSDPHSYVSVGKLNDTATSYSAAQYFAVAMLIMFLLYSGGTASDSLLSERDNHTLYRLQSMPISHVQILIGKMIGSSIVAMAQTLVIITVSYVLYGTNWGQQPVLLAVTCMLMIFASMTFAAIVSLLSKSSSSANNFMQVLIVTMTFFSGGFIPIPVGFIQNIGEFTLNHWGMKSILQIMLHGNISEIISSIGMLAGICATLLALTAIVYRKVGYHA